MLVGEQPGDKKDLAGRSFVGPAGKILDAALKEAFQARDAGQSEFVRVLQRRQGQLVCSPDEIAYYNGWVGAGELKQLAANAGKTQYAQRLLDNLR